MQDTSFQERVESTLAAIVEGISDFQKSMEMRMDKLEERMDRLEETVNQMRTEAAEDRARVAKIQVAARKTVQALAAI